MIALASAGAFQIIFFLVTVLFCSAQIHLILPDEMLSLDNCKKILNRSGKQYSEEEVKRIRDLLYKLARLEFNIYKKKENEKRNHLHKSIN